MTPVLECLIAVLIITIIVVLVVLTIFFVKLLEETTKTMESLKDTLKLTKQELEPAFKSINGMLATVNEVTQATNKNIALVKKVAATALGASVMAITKIIGGKDSGFFSGLKSGFSIFRRRR